MIELKDNQLIFSFPEVHKHARCSIEFQRTLRIPDDNRSYPLPPGLGSFPLDHVDNLGDKLPEPWKRHGGIYFPMYQSEAMWINFSNNYPFAIKIAAGKVNALTGESWANGIHINPQDYLVAPDQPWLDGFCVAKGLIRQFVAMPLGEGFSAEEQLSGEAEHGGIQIIACPMKAEYYYEHIVKPSEGIMFSGSMPLEEASPDDMGLAPGGLMRQEIYEDDYGIDAWETSASSRCFVHIANSAVYQQLTGRRPPDKPPNAKDYTEAGLPWFDYYSDGEALSGADNLAGLTSVAGKWVQKTQKVLPENNPVEPKNLINLGNAQVREGEF